MPTLYLIRHGKASPGTDDYDQLHALGERQSVLLGQHLARDAVRFDAVYVGPLKRQQATWLHLQRGAGELAAAWPAALGLEGLSEAPYEELARHMIATRMGHDAELLRILEAIQAAGTDKQLLGPLLFRLMEYMNELWHRGELAVDGVETAQGFRARLEATLQRVLGEQPGERRVALITSNGVIGGILELVEPSGSAVLPLPTLRNASVSVLEADADGVRIVARDLTTHLPEPELLTLL